MKIQNLSIIFLVIIIPLIMILSYYLDLQKDTLKLQTEYDTKLAEATKEGIKAFEVNTVDWSEWVSEKTRTTERNDVSAAINTVITSLANNLNISGTAKEFMVNYIPAIAVTMYDGYYIYAPSYVPVTMENENGLQYYYDSGKGALTTDSNSGANPPAYKKKDGGKTNNNYIKDDGSIVTEPGDEFVTNLEEAEMEYKHTLSTQISYVERYSKDSDTNVVVNYTLDNRIYVYGTVGGESVEKDGYLVYFDDDSILPRIEEIDPTVQNDSAIKVIDDKRIDNTVYSNGEIETQIEAETLEEQVLYYEDTDRDGDKEYNLGTFKYVYDISHNKLYYDKDADDFFTINPSSKEKIYISTNNIIKYKSVSVLLGDGETTEYKKLYMPLNGKDKGIWCINLKEDSGDVEEIDTKIGTVIIQKLGLENGDSVENLCKDYSAINYYVEAYAFTNWARDNLSGVKIYTEDSDSYEAIQVEGRVVDIFDIGKIKNTTEINDPEKDGSPIVVHKEQVMKENIITNLNLSISNYSMGTYEFKLPVLTDKDWDQVFSNISIITFFQGIPIGLKYYNNYSIATSTTNREYVDPEEIYFSGEDTSYHKSNCDKCENKVYTGYRSVEYALKEFIKYDIDNETILEQLYYYQHDNLGDTDSETACYYCVVNRANYVAIADPTDERLEKQTQSYNEALARERYYQKEDIQAKMNVTITYHYNIVWEDCEEDQTVAGRLQDGYQQELEIGVWDNIVSEVPAIKSNNPNEQFIFDYWIDDNGIRYDTDGPVKADEDINLYAKYRISFTNLDWNRDFYWIADETGFETGYCYGDGYWTGTWQSGVYDGSRSFIKTGENDDGSIVQMVGNSKYIGKGATWTEISSNRSVEKFQFDYEITKGDSFNAGGLMFNIIETDTTLEGFMLSINFAGDFLSEAENESGAIYKFTYNKGTHNTNLTDIDLIKPLKIGESKYRNGTIYIEVIDTGYKISGTELTEDYYLNVIDYGYEEVKPNKFGFFSDHYSHSCKRLGYFKLDNIKVTVGQN